MKREEVRAFAKRVKKLYIEHEEVRRIWDKFDSLRENNKQFPSENTLEYETEEGEEDEDVQDPRNLFLMGLSGAGKSQIGKRYAKKNPGYLLETEDEKIQIKPVLYVELPFPFTQFHFYASILKALGTNNLRKDARINHVKDRVVLLLKKQRTELIFFDEMNYIMRTTRFDNQEAMEMLKDLTNKCKICVVCSGTPKIRPLRVMEDEYIRRFGEDEVKRFETCDESFCNLLERIEQVIQPPKLIGLGDPSTGLPELLHYYSQGRIGYLHLLLKEAYRIIGINKEDFDDFNKAILTVEAIKVAKHNLFGKSDHLINPTDN